MRLYRTTQLFPATVSQEMREIVSPDASAPPGSYRVVQLLVPSQPTVRLALYPDPRFVDERDSPLFNIGDAMGSNRTYKAAMAPSGAYIPIALLPNQTIWAAAEEGLAEVSVLIEYREGDR